MMRSWDTARLIPIEINPCRFGSYGLPDLGFYGYGFNPYQRLFGAKRAEKAAEKELTGGQLCGTIMSFVVACRPPARQLDLTNLKPDCSALCADLPGEISCCMEVDWKRLPFFAIVSLRQTPAQLSQLVDMLSRISWRDYWHDIHPNHSHLTLQGNSSLHPHPYKRGEDTRERFLREELTLEVLQELFSGKVAAVVIPDYCPSGLILKVFEYLDNQSGIDYTHELYDPDTGHMRYQSYGVTRVGEALNTIYRELSVPYDQRTLRENQAIESYLNECPKAVRSLRRACEPYPAPTDKLRLELDDLWPWGAHVGSILCKGPDANPSKLYSGIGRLMRGGDPAMANLESQPHFDCLPPHLIDIECQFSANIYVSVPTAGGQLELWPQAKPLAFDEIERTAAGTDWRAKLAQEAVQQSPSVLIQPRLGDLILLNTRMPHAVRQFDSGKRYSIQTFLGYRHQSPLLLWN